MIDKLFSQLSALPEVEAIALGGSRAGDHFDEKSDYDVYLYCTAPIDEARRREILSQVCSYMEIGNHFWEYEDNCTLNTGIDIDILYRNLDDFTADVASVVESHYPHNGYTTCMWHNLLTCKIICDKRGRLAAAKERFNIPYPEALKKNIVQRNWQLLHSAMPAYEEQIKKAANRRDWVSVNHRTAAFLESYFDILFALNGQTHPGEKRMVQYCLERCAMLPENFENNLNTLLSHLFTEPDRIAQDLTAILTALAKIL